MKIIPSIVDRKGSPARAAATAFVLASVALTSCHFNVKLNFDEAYDVEYEDSAGPAFLAKHVAEADGSVTTYSVSGQSRRFPKSNRDLKGGVLVSTDSSSSFPYLGIEVTSVDGDTAGELGIDPWVGVLVSQVEDDQPAAVAGLRRGDLLLSAGDAVFRSDGEFAEFVTRDILPGETVAFQVSRPVSDFVRDELEVPVLVGDRSVDETESNRVDLDMHPGLVHRAGIGVVTVSSDLSGEIWGSPEPTALVAAVVTGSPAYLAGVRAGDRVLRAGGVPVNTAEELAEMAKRSGELLDLEVDGRLGDHSASIPLKEDVLAESDFEIPILVDYEKSAARKDLSVLNFIFQFGFNKHTRYGLSTTRNPRKNSSLSILPLGMFEFERTPTKATNRLFWFITWSSEI